MKNLIGKKVKKLEVNFNVFKTTDGLQFIVENNDVKTIISPDAELLAVEHQKKLDTILDKTTKHDFVVGEVVYSEHEGYIIPCRILKIYEEIQDGYNDDGLEILEKINRIDLINLSIERDEEDCCDITLVYKEHILSLKRTIQELIKPILKSNE